MSERLNEICENIRINVENDECEKIRDNIIEFFNAVITVDELKFKYRGDIRQSSEHYNYETHLDFDRNNIRDIRKVLYQLLSDRDEFIVK
ncbi:hypothetical protein KQY27_00190 [Methanobrevibacter sp. TMH8]|uniref:hypothetical protein n=1 Tax=Methanobrevibacter sp. TMH8 TaxID=2848611 RepID=UPI001CCCB50A|nr:hypothetical protein [Methanobrevibacter sp. TMH8]MBZ9569977.1 hypothetical protein [Methanobrevibacter sp. TMH8]